MIGKQINGSYQGHIIAFVTGRKMECEERLIYVVCIDECVKHRQ
jgi:hypothetical protein